MRSFLGWVVLVAVFAAAAYLITPLVARPLVADAVRATSPFDGEPLEVDVDADPVALLRGQVGSIHVTGSKLTSDRLDVGRLDVTANDVGLLDRSFGSVSGRLDAVTLRRADGTDIRAAEVHLSGPSEAIDATANVGRDAAVQLVRSAIEAAGLPADDVELIDGGVRMSVLGQRTDVALGAANGALTIAGSVAGGGSIVVFGPEPGDPWRITGVSVASSGLQVHVAIDLGTLLGGR
jgi:hypothetical protein